MMLLIMKYLITSCYNGADMGIKEWHMQGFKISKCFIIELGKDTGFDDQERTKDEVQSAK